MQWWAVQVWTWKFVLAQNVYKKIYVSCWVGCHFVMQRDSFTLWATFGPEMRWLKMQNVHDNLLLNFRLGACSSFRKLILFMVLEWDWICSGQTSPNILFWIWEVTKEVSIILNPPGRRIKYFCIIKHFGRSWPDICSDVYVPLCAKKEITLGFGFSDRRERIQKLWLLNNRNLRVWTNWWR